MQPMSHCEYSAQNTCTHLNPSATTTSYFQCYYECIQTNINTAKLLKCNAHDGNTRSKQYYTQSQMPGLILNYTAMQDQPFCLFSFANHCYERLHTNKAADNMHTLNIPTLNADVIDNTTQ